MDCEECKISLFKSSCSDQCVVGDLVTYKLEVKNTSCLLVEDIIVKDLLPSDLKFVKGSVRVNYATDDKANIIAGVRLGNIDPGETCILTFEAEIINKSSHQIVNDAIAEYKYQECDKYFYQCCVSNCNKILVKNPSINILKKVDKSDVYLEDELNYTISVTNNGDLDAFNVFLIDEMSPSLEIVDGSFYIDDVLVNSVEVEKGVVLDCLVTGETKIVKYKAKVVSGGCGGRIQNKARVKYSYRLPNGNAAYSQSNVSCTSINMSISSFKQLSIDEYLWIPNQKPNIAEINDIKVVVKINKCHIVKTATAKSSEGQILSGYKLVVHGTINQVIEYIADEPTQTVHSANYKALFSTFVILPPDFSIGSKVAVEGIVEDVYYNVVDERCFFKNVTLLILAKITCC